MQRWSGRLALILLCARLVTVIIPNAESRAMLVSLQLRKGTCCFTFYVAIQSPDMFGATD